MTLPTSIIRSVARSAAQATRPVHRIMNPRMVMNAIRTGQIRPTMNEQRSINFLENAMIPNNGGILVNYTGPRVEEITPGRYVLRNETIPVDDPNLTVSYNDATGGTHTNVRVTPELTAEAQRVLPGKIEPVIQTLPEPPAEVHLNVLTNSTSLPSDADLDAAVSRLWEINALRRAGEPISPEILAEEDEIVDMLERYKTSNGNPYHGAYNAHGEGSILEYQSTPIYDPNSGAYKTHYSDSNGSRLLYRRQGEHQNNGRNAREALKIMRNIPRGTFLQEMSLSSQSFPLVLRAAAANYGTGKGQATVVLTDDNKAINTFGDHAVYWDNLFSPENKKFAPVLQKVENIAKDVNYNSGNVDFGGRPLDMMEVLRTTLTPEEKLQFEGVLRDLYAEEQMYAIDMAKHAANKLVQQDISLAPILDRLEPTPFDYDIVAGRVLTSGKAPVSYTRPVIRVEKHKLGGFYKNPLYKSGK